MLAPRHDDVSNIHRHWSVTRINPSSSRVSYAIWIGCAVIIVVVSHVYNFQAGIASLALYLPLSLVFLVGSHFLDYLALRGTPVRKFSKIAHVSAFANVFWSLTVLLGIAADFVFSKSPSMDYVIAGMLLAVGFRIGLFISVFGASTPRAILVSFIQPVIFFFAFMPPSLYHSIATQGYGGIAFGAILLAIGIVWTVIADRAGRPGVKSTFGLLRAFLVAWSENRVDMIEELIEAKAHENLITTKVIRFLFAGSQAAIVLPEVHPGPFSMVGGSNLPYVLYKKFSKRALVMHSVSDHSLNIPSKKEVEKYVKDLGQMITKEKGGTCSAPVQVRINNSTSTGIAFGNTAMVMLSLAPTGMEDIPRAVSSELESFGATIGFSDVLVVDCHNAMGKHLDDSDRNDLIASAKQCLDQLKKQPQKHFKVGFASLDDVDYYIMDRTEELGQGGLAVLLLSIDKKNYVIGWADSNNMENTARDYIVSKINNNSNATTMLEICSSDTHSTSGKRTREGYFALGTTTNLDKIATAYIHLCYKAAEMAAESAFELACAQSAIKVMGKKQFEDYSSALDRSVNVTKIFVAITVAGFIAMLALS
jgi:putative membrane protein